MTKIQIIKQRIMYNNNPLELAVKFVVFPYDKVRHLADSISKAKTLAHVNQLCNQIDNYRRIASFASCCFPGEICREIHERCYRGINDCNNELRKLAKKTVKDEFVMKLTNNYHNNF